MDVSMSSSSKNTCGIACSPLRYSVNAVSLNVHNVSMDWPGCAQKHKVLQAFTGKA